MVYGFSRQKAKVPPVSWTRDKSNSNLQEGLDLTPVYFWFHNKQSERSSMSNRALPHLIEPANIGAASYLQLVPFSPKQVGPNCSRNQLNIDYQTLLSNVPSILYYFCRKHFANVGVIIVIRQLSKIDFLLYSCNDFSLLLRI